MPKIFNGRYTAKTDQAFVVFLIGMRVNQWWRFDKWVPVVSAMTPMLTTLFTHPEKGFLHAEFFHEQFLLYFYILLYTPHYLLLLIPVIEHKSISCFRYPLSSSP